MRIYLDNNASTPIDPAILESLPRWYRETFGNASSVHSEGQRARQLLEEGRDQLAALIGASSREVVFTSGGTESNNAAIAGLLAERGTRRHLVTSSIEHPAVLQPLARLREAGYEVTVIGCDARGVVDDDRFISSLRDDTALATLMLANNESGVIQRVAGVAAACRERGIPLHCDAVQAIGKIDVDVSALGVDTLSMSGHKFHAPKGVGALWVHSGVRLQSFVAGGAQERRRRAGTENVVLAAAMGAAASLGRPEAMRRIAVLRDALEHEAQTLGATVNGRDAERLPTTTNLCFPGVDGEGLVIGLDLEGVAVSSGSACSSGRVEPSHVLLEMGLSEEDARSSIRVSLSRLTTNEEIQRFLSILSSTLPRHRKREASQTRKTDR